MSVTRKYIRRELDKIDVEDIFFQQDRATSHTTRETMVLLQSKSSDRAISRFGAQHWPPSPFDYNTHEIFSFWRYVKERVYANKTKTIERLKEKI